jgi:hypothetical protein
MIAGAIVLAALAACQGAAKEKQPPRRVGPSAAAEVAAAPSDVPAGTPSDVSSQVPSDVSFEMPPASAADAAPPSPDGASHCGEAPEQAEARANMARMAEAHRALEEQLARVRDAYLEYARKLFERRPWEELPGAMREFAVEASAVPGWRPVAADGLEWALREATLLESACRSLRADPAACDTADGIASEGAHDCRLLAQLLDSVHQLAQGESLDQAVPLVGSTDDPALIDAGRAALLGGDVAACDRFGKRGQSPADWATAFCRAVAGRDRAACDGLSEPRERARCGMFAAWLLSAIGHPFATGGAGEAVLLRRLDELAQGEDCGARALALLAAGAEVAAAFVPSPLVLPEIERERGLAPP